MMIGTVMMSNPPHPPTTQNITDMAPTDINGHQNINTISNTVPYMSDSENKSNRIYGNQNQQQYMNTKQIRNGCITLDGNGLSYDQQPMVAPSIPKPVDLKTIPTITSDNNSTNKFLNDRTTNINNMTNSVYTESSTANNLRKQQSHQHQHNSSRYAPAAPAERSVNFQNENDNDNENTYTKIKLEKRSKERENKHRESRRHESSSRHEKHRDEKNLVDNKNLTDDQNNMQVQIIPQDDNWGENTTAFTADFSDFNDDMTEDGRSSHFNFGKPGRNFKNNKDGHHLDDESRMGKEQFIHGCNLHQTCHNYFGYLCSLCVSFCAFITPILFIILPRLNIWKVNECGLECEGLLVGIAFKMFILLVGSWALFGRKPRTTQLPRVYELRTLLIVLLCLMTFSYWLFYAVRIIETQTPDYYEILQFTVSYVDVLLFVFIISVFVIEIRQTKPEFVVKIVRSPDGECREYNLGRMSIQRAAIWLLEQYYKDFPVYNPWLENNQRKRTAQLLKLEQGQVGKKKRVVGGKGDDEDTRSVRSRMDTASMVGGNFSANDRFYEEYEYERRLRKRRARLLTTTEEAFAHVRRIQNEPLAMPDENGLVPAQMDPFDTAQAVFTSIARDLRRYLRVTRQQPYFTRESIIAHLANCISYDMSPKSFLQRYLKSEPLIFNERALVSSSPSSAHNQMNNGIGSHGVNYHLNLKTMDQSWILICDTPLYQNCEDNLMFVLKQNEVSLMCTFKRMPRFNLIEDILDPQRNKFVIKFNSETTV